MTAPAGQRYRIEPLDIRHDRSAFGSGVDALDRYLKTQAGQDQRRRIASVFLAVHRDTETIGGYYTLAAASVVLAELPPDLVKRLPRYPSLPAVLLGRLAVHRDLRGRRLGEHLLFDAMARSARSDIAAFAFIVDAKDETAEAFYRRYGFLPLAASCR